jgi:hypothetical protein
MIGTDAVGEFKLDQHIGQEAAEAARVVSAP